MSFVPEEELKAKEMPTFAPMIDFLFIMLMFFASLAISRVTTRDTDVTLVKIATACTSLSSPIPSQEFKVIHLSINNKGEYTWSTEIHDYPMDSAQAISQELAQQYAKGLLPEDKSKTQVLLRIDKEAQWEPIVQLILAIREQGFEVRPVYQEDDAA